MRLFGACLALALVLGAVAEDAVEEVTVETVKQEDDVAYITPDHHPDVFFSDHFDHQVSLVVPRCRNDGPDVT